MMMLSFTDESTKKRLLIRFEVVLVVREHESRGTLVWVQGREEPYWVSEATDDVLAAIAEITRKIQSAQMQGMIRNGGVRR